MLALTHPAVPARETAEGSSWDDSEGDCRPVADPQCRAGCRPALAADPTHRSAGCGVMCGLSRLGDRLSRRITLLSITYSPVTTSSETPLGIPSPRILTLT